MRFDQSWSAGLPGHFDWTCLPIGGGWKPVAVLETAGALSFTEFLQSLSRSHALMRHDVNAFANFDERPTCSVTFYIFALRWPLCWPA